MCLRVFIDSDGLEVLEKYTKVEEGKSMVKILKKPDVPIRGSWFLH